MTVSILGCGWYGLALAKALVADGFTVKGSTTSPDKLPLLQEAGLIPFIVDLSADTVANSGFFTCDVLVIAIPPKARSGAGAEYVPKLERAIEAIHHAGVQKVILISSTGVYADLNQEVTELDTPNPNTPAGEVLFEAEELFRKQTAFKTTILRFAGLIGPGRDPGRFFAGKKNIPNGLAPVNLIQRTDCIGITKAIVAQNFFGHTVNACVTHHPTKMWFYTKAAAESGLPLPEFIPELKEWKTISSKVTGDTLQYSYVVKEWYPAV
ncbi:SDR family oxidoreductase [Mucilaginibacter pedocola]|uniref:NAD(P)-binding domain-containing protein n=1 Tax=Mucilaginibacter pedocola TaxID=1792845 RepID=A0A1S9PJJ7_9SPHI|nr:SDR family oxidoreductase [Mucilaginibacter pedocola]OOQ61140.1 hypothetical protein BC343_22115 [Mucilaginibacter pedocola]